MQESIRTGATRRELLRGGARLALALPLAAASSSAMLAGCGSGDESPASPPKPKPSPPAAPAAPATPEPAPTPPAPAPVEPAPEPVTGGGGEGGGELVTDLAAAAPMVAALQYVNVSAKPDQNCANCQLYTAGEGGVGKCQLFPQGSVKEGGWCASWAQKVT